MAPDTNARLLEAARRYRIGSPLERQSPVPKVLMPPILQGVVDLIVGDTWLKRRKVVYVSLVFYALVIAYCLGAARPPRA